MAFATSLPRGAKTLFILTGMVVGLGTGIGTYTFVYAKGASYMSNEPSVCANCHIMQDHYDAWRLGSHHAVATCNDCHLYGNIVQKYYVKAENGFRHSVAFTTGRFHEPIQITERNHRVVENACRKCHADIVQMIDRNVPEHGDDSLSCVRCHREVGHKE